MREGYEPFRDIFSSQGPLFLPLVRLADLAGFETLDAPRLLPVLAGAVTTVAVYFAGRELMDRGRALLAAALTGSSGVLLWTTGPLTSDGTAAAISVSAVAVALVYRRRPSTLIAIAIAVLAGSAFSVKNLLVTPALLIAWVLVLSRRRILDAVLVPLGALAVLAPGLGAVGLQRRLPGLDPVPPRQDRRGQPGRQCLQARHDLSATQPHPRRPRPWSHS